MSIRAGIVDVLFRGDFTQLAAGLEGLEKSLKGTGERLSSIGTRLSVNLSAPLVAAGYATFRAAADLQRTETAFDATFGKLSQDAAGFARDLAQTLGLELSDVKEQVIGFQRVMQGLDFKPETALQASKALEIIAQDITARFGTPIEEVTAGLASGLGGATRGLKELGIYVNDTSLKQIALRMGFLRGTEQMNLQAKSAAVLVAILEQASRQYGNLGPKMDTPLGRLRQMEASFSGAAESIGTLLMPIATAVLGGLRWLADAAAAAADTVGRLPPGLKAVGAGLLVVATGMGPVLLAAGQLMKLLSGLPAAFALAASGAGVTVAAFAVIAGGAVFAATHVYQLQRGLLAIWVEVKSAIVGVPLLIVETIQKLGEMGDALQGLAATLPQPLAGMVTGFARLAQTGGTALEPLRQNLEAFRDRWVGGSAEKLHDLDVIIADLGASSTRSAPQMQGLLQLIAQLMAMLRGQHLGEGATEDVAKAVEELERGLRRVHDSALLLAPTYDALSERQQVMGAAIKKLLELGVPLDAQLGTTGQTLRQLAEDYRAGTIQLDQHTGALTRARAIIEDTKQTNDQFRDSAERLADRLDRLKALYEAGGLGADVYRRAVARTKYEMGLATGDLGALMLQHGLEAGRSLIEGFILGTASLMDTLRRFVAQVLGDYVVKTVERSLGIASPSKVAAGWGQRVAEGFHGGLTRSAHLIRGSVAGAFSMAGPLMPAFAGGGIVSVPGGGLPAGGPVHITRNYISAMDSQDVARALRNQKGTVMQLHVEALQESDAYRNAHRGL